MDEDKEPELIKHFAPPSQNELPADVMGELQSMLRLHSISPQELFYKWESYSIRMGSEETKLDLPTARAFKTHLQDSLERENKTRAHMRCADKRNLAGDTPRNIRSKGDRFGGILDGLMPSTPEAGKPRSLNGSSLKRKAGYDSPAVSKINNEPQTPQRTASTPHGVPDGVADTPKPSSFANRPNAGQIVETLNTQLPQPDPPLAPSAEPRIKLTVNTDLKKFSYRPMAMHSSEASEVLDDRIDEFAAAVQAHHGLPDSAFGNAASQSTNEIVAVGRIASDALDAKLNAASLVLEMSRRMGAGLRVPLKIDNVPSFEFFPGQVVALRGVNASGEYFSAKEILGLPLLPVPASTFSALDAHSERLRGGPDAMEDADPRPLTFFVGGGPYTADDNLAFEPLYELCNRAATAYADVLILTGPFIDLEHPLIATGDFDLPPEQNADPDTATLKTLFRAWISPALRSLAEAVPSITICLVPSVRDAISKHVSWPQEALPRKELGLPKQARMLSNPVTVSLNEILVGISSQDILAELRQEEVVGPSPRTPSILVRLPRHLIEQRHFFPLFPSAGRHRLPKIGAGAGLPTGAMLDTSYLKLGEWLNVRPDILVTPSALPPFAKVVESVLVINPGTVSRRKAPGTYTQLAVYPLVSGEERTEGKMIPHKLFERARVDVVKV